MQARLGRESCEASGDGALDCECHVVSTGSVHTCMV